MLKRLKQIVCEANLRLVDEGLVIFTWGNVSGIDRERGIVVIKPSGVDYDGMHWQQMVAVELESGKILEGELKPSSDTPTHLELYRNFQGLGGIVHTHSRRATAWAQANTAIPAYGTTHADYFYGEIPCTRSLRTTEIESDYELNTGKVIVETFQTLDPDAIPAVLVANHAPFVWGPNITKAVENAVVLEYVAAMASEMLTLNPATKKMPQDLLDKHFLRKHGKDAYYGQS